jgi:integrase
MIKNRGKHTWLIQIYLGRDTTGKKKYYYETFHSPTKSLAQQREKELSLKLKSRTGPKQVMNFGEYLDVWLQKMKGSVADNTYKTYEYQALRIRPFVKDLQLWTLTGDDLKTALQNNFPVLSPRSINNLYGVARMIVLSAIAAHKAPVDALAGFRTEYDPKKDRPTLNREQLEIFINHTHNYKHGLIVRLLALTGARISEILGLTLNQIDFENGIITIDQAVDIHTRKLKNETKNQNSRRSIILDDETIELLKQHINNSTSNIVRPINKNDNLVFQSIDGRPIKYSAVYNTVKRILKQAGFRDMRIHDLRHSAITLLLKEGIPVITVASLAGQDVATTTGKYAQKIKVTKAIEIQKDLQNGLQ